MPDVLAPPAVPAVHAQPVPRLSDLRAPVEDHLAAFRTVFREAMRSRVGLLDRVVQYVLKRKGKEIRPTLVLLSADMCGGVGPASYTAAALVELLHTATLVHDDVVDEAESRRGAFSINAVWKNKIAVLLGDYLLSRGLLLALDDKEYELLHTMSDAVRRMSEGELLQIETARRLDITEETYFRIISDKTASLISACMGAGAVSARADEETVALARDIGERLGLAFQIRDDLFDYDAIDVGKPTGLDLQDRKMTLPLITALANVDDGERRRVMRIVRKRKKSRAQIAEVIAFAHEAGGVAEARRRMETLAAEASERLRSFPPSASRDALIGLCAYVVARKR